MIIYCLVTLLTSSLFSSQCCSLTAFLQLLPLAVSSADLLPRPTLSADPSYHFYYEGEYVALICLATTKRNIGGFRFFNQSGDQIYLQAPYSLPKARLQLTATKASGGYTCMYFVEDSGHQIPSNRSLPLSLEVRDAPVAPTLSLEPQQQFYRIGDSVRLLCSIPSSADYVREVQYYTDYGSQMSIPVSNVRNYSYELSITEQEVSGSYSCAYFVTLPNRAVLSKRSHWINVNMKSHKISWIREIIVGGSFFTINGLIFFFSHRLMKRRDLKEGFRMD
ncbi:uncharacterized protein LOC129197961 [Grus americana]|uniref:uncharacterized protein LOC129197961 n=1 Tax=Grus americana TaxID=9117 RepID=UPI002407D900|nr:uncharacterized protein LOC129197961 [Grus americana]